MKNMTAKEVLANVNAKLAYAESIKARCNYSPKYMISKVYKDLSIFDWWNESLSISQLKQMRKFLEVAIELGFTGYVCFKVGAKYCSHGMWAHTEESVDGYSPVHGGCLFHSFRNGDNYYDVCPDYEAGGWTNQELSLKDVKRILERA